MPTKPSIELLKSLAYQSILAKSPHVVAQGEAEKLKSFVHSYTDKTEKGFIRCIVDYLTFSGHQAERVENKGTRVDNRKIVTNVLGQVGMIGSVNYHYSQNKNGTSDVHSVIRKKFTSSTGAVQFVGVAVKWEIKLPGDTQKEHQMEYAAEVEKAGGRYFIVRDMDDFVEKYEGFIRE